ncbi:MAG: nucleotide pyrophosphohydrolase [candidate division WOR-3 bacterium]|nr:nucleotide pyrophosphohydrolase [candidate division WOR-3 bacterium]
MTIEEFQTLIEKLYYPKDKARGLERTFIWFTEEVGELAREIKKHHSTQKPSKKLSEEFADCFAWLVTLASICNVRLEDAIKKYVKGCPKCHKTPCRCPEKTIT